MSKFEKLPFRYNYWLASEYWHDAPNIASRFWDLDPKCDWSLLASVWHSKNDFGRKLDPVLSVQNIYEASKKPEFQVDPIARVIHACWLGYCKGKEDEKPVVILPPPPEPPPVVVIEQPKLPEVKLPQEPKPTTKTPWKLIAAVLAAVAFALKFSPVPAFVIGIVDMIVKIVQSIPQ
jgi:hypothetical protein